MAVYTRPVPELELTPELPPPLFAWEPRAYVQLLIRLFWHPQALVAYMQSIGLPKEGMGLPSSLGDPAAWQRWWVENRYRRHLIGIALILLVCLTLTIDLLVLLLGWRWAAPLVTAADRSLALLVTLTLNLAAGICFGLTFAAVVAVVALLLKRSLAQVIVFSLLSGAVLGATFTLVTLVATPNVALRLTDAALLGLLFGTLIGLMFSLIGPLSGGAPLDLFYQITGALAFNAIWACLIGPFQGGAAALVASSAGTVALLVTLPRPDDWLLAWLRPISTAQDETVRWPVPHVTLLPVPQVRQQLVKWLKQDWKQGLRNVRHLLEHARQHKAAVDALNQVLLQETPQAQIVGRVAELSADPDSWALVWFVSAPMEQLFLPMSPRWVWPDFTMPFWRPNQKAQRPGLRSDKPARAAAAGLCLLHDRQPAQAATAFKSVEKLGAGGELAALARNLDSLKQLGRVGEKTPLTLEPRPAQATRKESWEALDTLRTVDRLAWIYSRSRSEASRAAALNEARATLQAIRESGLPDAERGLFLEIVESWEKIFATPETIARTPVAPRPVTNPYVVAKPVVAAQPFIGRDSQIKSLQEYWQQDHFQPVLLSGQRRIGKTSVLFNARDRLGPEIRLIHISFRHLAHLAEQEGALVAAICASLTIQTRRPPVGDGQLQAAPFQELERQIRDLCRTLRPVGLILALDDFDYLDRRQGAPLLLDRLMLFLWQLSQTERNFGVAIVSTYGAQELRHRYGNPLSSQLNPIPVSYLDLEGVERLLQSPAADFLPYYTGPAVSAVFQLTAGQPYLIQLIGNHLIQQYNERLARKVPQDPILTDRDIAEVTAQPEFRARCQVYTNDLLEPATQILPDCRPIFAALQGDSDGLGMNAAALMRRLAMDADSLRAGLELLETYELVRRIHRSRWQIPMGLLRQPMSEGILSRRPE